MSLPIHSLQSTPAIPLAPLPPVTAVASSLSAGINHVASTLLLAANSPAAPPDVALPPAMPLFGDHPLSELTISFDSHSMSSAFSLDGIQPTEMSSFPAGSAPAAPSGKKYSALNFDAPLSTDERLALRSPLSGIRPSELYAAPAGSVAGIPLNKTDSDSDDDHLPGFDKYNPLDFSDLALEAEELALTSPLFGIRPSELSPAPAGSSAAKKAPSKR